MKVSRETAVNTNLWPQILAAHGTIGQSLPPATREAVQELLFSYGVGPKYIFHFVYVVENYEATALSTAHYQKRDPFDHPDSVDEFWAGCRAAGFLQPNDEGTLKITEKGEAVRHQRWQILNEGLATLTLLPDAELDQINALMARVVEETAVSTTRSSAWALHTRRQAGLRPRVAPLASLAQFIELRMDLGAYRDDAHLAAWREPYPISPHAWEILGTIWQSETATLSSLTAALGRRGFSETETAVALKELIRLEWLEQKQENYRLTELGRTVRHEAEQNTNLIFYSPWSILTAAELETLESALAAFRIE